MKIRKEERVHGSCILKDHMDYLKTYYEVLNERFLKILKEEQNEIDRAGRYIAEWLSKDDKNLLYVIGTGEHSTLAANEIYKRAGGMPCVFPIFSAAAQYERIPGLIAKDFDKYDIPEGAPIIIASHVGMNAFTIETALLCKRKKLFLIGIEATEILSKLPKDFAGWSENKLTLRDICDVTIDHKTPFGDATVQIQGIESPAGPVSNIHIFFIMHLIEIAAYEHMAKIGYQPDIYISGNIPGGDEHNLVFNEKYRKLIKFW